MDILENQQFIFGSIFLLSNKLQLLGDRITGELTLKQWLLLNIILNMGKQEHNLQEIAKATGYTRQNVSKMISILEKKGMVSLVTPETDHRSVHVVLTEKCMTYFKSKEKLGNTLLGKLFQGMDYEETNKLASLLGHLLLNAETAQAKEVKD